MRSVFRYCPFRSTKKPISGCNMVLFVLQYRLYCKPKWCFLQCRKIPFKHKPLIYNVLWKPLIFRVFAPEEEPVRKYALIFRGRVGNFDLKIKNRLQFESRAYCSHFSSREQCISMFDRRIYYIFSQMYIYILDNIWW